MSVTDHFFLPPFTSFAAYHTPAERRPVDTRTEGQNGLKFECTRAEVYLRDGPEGPYFGLRCERDRARPRLPCGMPACEERTDRHLVPRGVAGATNRPSQA